MNDQRSLPCVCINTRRAANALTAYYDRRLAPLCITTGQYSLLANIGRVGSTNITNLTRIVKLDKSTLTRTLAPLVEAGYIEYGAGRNRREVVLSLTGDGQELLDRAIPLWEQAQAEVEDYLGGAETRALIDALKKLQDLK